MIPSMKILTGNYRAFKVQGRLDDINDVGGSLILASEDNEQAQRRRNKISTCARIVFSRSEYAIVL